MRYGILFAAALAVGIAGCASPVRHQNAENIDAFAAMLDGKKMSTTDVRGDAQDPQYGYKVIRSQVETVQSLCVRDGGELQGKFYYKNNPSHQRELAIRTLAGNNGAMDAPSLLICNRAGKELWAVAIDYVDIRRSGYISLFGGHYIYFTPIVKVIRPEELQRLRETAKVEAEERNRRNQEQLRAEAEKARIAQAAKNERDAKFRANLKQGDLFQWKLNQLRGTGYGMVVRIERKLAFVQFENVTFAGQNTRYIPIDELEPRDGPVHSARYSIP